MIENGALGDECGYRERDELSKKLWKWIDYCLLWVFKTRFCFVFPVEQYDQYYSKSSDINIKGVSSVKAS